MTTGARQARSGDMTLLEAISRQEGFDVQGSRAKRNNNPGNINFGPFARLHGATHEDGEGYAVFPDPATGFWALDALLKSARYKGHTLEEALYIFCPPKGDPRGDNPTAEYVKNVSQWTGIRPEESIDLYV